MVVYVVGVLALRPLPPVSPSGAEGGESFPRRGLRSTGHRRSYLGESSRPGSGGPSVAPERPHQDRGVGVGALVSPRCPAGFFIRSVTPPSRLDLPAPEPTTAGTGRFLTFARTPRGPAQRQHLLTARFRWGTSLAPLWCSAPLYTPSPM